MAESQTEKKHEPVRYRRSTRAEKALQNARFMAAAGFVFGTVFGVLVGIKFNIGAKPPVYVPAETNRSAANETIGNAGGIDSTNDTSETEAEAAATLAQINNYQGKVPLENPLRGIWTAKFNEFAVTLNFTKDLNCEVYEPVTAGGKVMRAGKFVDSVPYEVKVLDEAPEWAPVEDETDLFQWSGVDLITTYEYTNRDGSTGTAKRSHRVALTARYTGKDTPQDSDDYIIYVAEFLGEFFDLGEAGRLITTPASRKWERRIEANFRNHPNPAL